MRVPLPKRMSDMLQLFTLGTPVSRVIVWAVLTLAIYAAPFSWLENLSLYKAVGIDEAPSIGLTRAYWYMLHGRLDDALAMNRLILGVLCIGVPILLYDGYRIISSIRAQGR